MASASNMLGGSGTSSAADRLAAKGQPSGKAGSPDLTLKLRNQFSEYRTQNIEATVQWEDWLESKGYGIGDNNHVYKK